MTQLRVIRRDDAGGAPAQVQRFACSQIRKDRVQSTAAGGLVVDAAFTRSGVFAYLDEAGNVRREWRPPDEVLKVDSMATLRDAPVTVLHPPGLVDSGNWKTYSVGHQRGELGSERDKDGGAVTGQMVLNERTAIEQTLSGALKEISCGYQCILDVVAGITDTGEQYDAIQRGIVYNHISIGPDNWGRQGSDISMRLDAAGNQLPLGAAPTGTQAQEQETAMKIKVIKLDGTTVEIEAGCQEHLEIEAAKNAEIARLRKDNETITGERDGLRTTNTKLTTDLAAAPAAAAKQIAARTALEMTAKKVLGAEYKCDGIADRDLMIAAIVKTDPEFKADGKSDDYVAGRFESATRIDATPEQKQIAYNFGTGNDGTHQDSKDPKAYKTDPNDPDPDKSREAMIARHQDAWKTKPAQKTA